MGTGGETTTRKKAHKRRVCMRNARLDEDACTHKSIYKNFAAIKANYLSKENDWKKIARNYMMIKYGLRAQTHHTYTFCDVQLSPGLEISVWNITRCAVTHTHTHTPVLYGILFPILMPSSHSIWRMKWSGKKIESISIKCHTNEWNTSNPNKQFQGNDIRTQLKLAFGFFSSRLLAMVQLLLRFGFHFIYLFVYHALGSVIGCGYCWWWWWWVFWCWCEQWNSECGCFQTIFAFISNSNSFQLNV